MIFIGCHLSVSDGYEAMGKTMQRYGGNTFAWFTRNPRGGKTKEVPADDMRGLMQRLEDGFGPLVAHGSYTMNLCAANPQTRENGLEMLKKDLQRMELLPGNYYNFHPGSHVGQGEETGIRLIAEALNQTMKPQMKTTVLLETMAGKGSEIGRDFKQLKEIIDRTDLKDKVGVCFDTCHVWDAGYDLVGKLDEVLDEFDRIIGLDYLKAVHLNDSRNDRGSRKDRHEKLGEGFLGKEAVRRIVLHPALQDRPFILETPNDEEGYIREIHMVRDWMGA